MTTAGTPIRRGRRIVAVVLVAVLAWAAAACSPEGRRSLAPDSPVGRAFRPPALVNPEVVRVPDNARRLRLRADRDYIVRLPDTRPVSLPDGLRVDGGHNVVIIGGAVDVGDGVTREDGSIQRRAALFSGQTGTLHVEGVRFLSPADAPLTEGIDLDEREGATVVFQNVVVERVVGDRRSNHADGIQTWAGPRRLLVDGLTIETTYQGLFLLPNQHYDGPPPVLVDLRHVYVRGAAGCGYLLWKDDAPWRIELRNVYVEPCRRIAGGRDGVVWPKGDDAWAGVRIGRPPQPYATTAGAGYRPPVP